MKQHPFRQDSGTTLFPSQNIPLSKRNENWKKANVDAAEFEALQQFYEKQKLANNYRLANDDLIYEDYGKDEESPNYDLISELTKESGVPDVIKNYGIISQPIATLEGEMDAFPDVFNVIGKGDIFESEKERVKTGLLKDWFSAYIEETVNNKLLELSGDDPDAELFQDQEKYQQAYQQQLTVMFPPQIQKYMNTSYKHILELWGQNELKDQFERFKLKSLRRKDFYHWLRVAQRFRHLYVGSKGLKVESLNPLFTFCRKSPNIENVQDGDLAGFIQILSVPAIIDRYGDLMTEKQLNSLENPYDSEIDGILGKRPDGSSIDYLSPRGNKYQTRVSVLAPDFENIFPEVGSVGNLNGVLSTTEELSKIDGTSDSFVGPDMLCVTTVYWRSQRRVGKLHWINPESGLDEILLVDETFDIPKYIKQIKNEKFNFEAGINTLIWTRETEIWQGIKINNYGSSNVLLEEALYLDIKPAEIQIGRLPIAGHFANNINTVPTSLVDKIKSWQWIFNILINQSVLFIQTEILPFALFTANMIPNDKDYGGEQGLAKWVSIAHSLGLQVTDPNPNGMPDNAGGQYPKIVDLDRGARILTRINLALQIKQLALEQIGISPQRMGAVKASETATGINQSISNSGTQTSSWFTSFFEGEKEMLQLQLDAAKYLQARGKQIDTVNKSEISIEALRLALEDGDLYDLHVYISDSQEELRNLQVARQLALENNTSEMMMSDRLLLSTGTSVLEVIEGLKDSERQMIERRNQEMQLKQQELEQQGLNTEAAREQAERHFTLELQNKIQTALITAMGRQKDVDVDDNGIADLLEYNKIINANNAIEAQNSFNNSKLQLETTKNQNDINLKNKQMQFEREKMLAEYKLEKEKLKRATVQGDKSK